MRLVFRTILNETCSLPMSSGEISNETEYDVTCWKDSPTLYAAVRKSIISVGSLMWGRTESCRMTSTFLYMLMGNCRKTKILVKQHSTLYTRGQNSRLMSNYEFYGYLVLQEGQPHQLKRSLLLLKDGGGRKTNQKKPQKVSYSIFYI